MPWLNEPSSYLGQDEDLPTIGESGPETGSLKTEVQRQPTNRAVIRTELFK